MAAMTAERLANVLGTWAAGEGALYVQLALALQHLVEDGTLPAGTRLPPERRLAVSLAVSRPTVVAALNWLRAAGTLVRRQGSGTWIADGGLPEQVDHPAQGEGMALFTTNRVLRRNASPQQPALDLISAYPRTLADAGGDRLTDAMPLSELAVECDNGGYSPTGLPALRETIADHLTGKGIPTIPPQVLITTGIQQAMDLLARLYLADRETVVVESPTWSSALDVFRAAQARLVTVTRDEQPATAHTIDDLAAAIQRYDPKMVFLIPDAHNPTGLHLPDTTRQLVASLAEAFQIPIVEDLALSELNLSPQPVPPPIGHYCAQRWIVSLGSLSKLFWPGLRIGWIRAPEPVIARLARLKALADVGTPIVAQALAVRLFSRTDEVAQIRQRQLKSALAALETSLNRLLPDWSWRQPDGGWSVWTRLPTGSGAQFAQVALRHGVEIAAGPVFAADDDHASCIRLSLAPAPHIIEEAIARLAQAWHAYSWRT